MNVVVNGLRTDKTRKGMLPVPQFSEDGIWRLPITTNFFVDIVKQLGTGRQGIFFNAVNTAFLIKKLRSIDKIHGELFPIAIPLKHSVSFQFPANRSRGAMKTCSNFSLSQSFPKQCLNLDSF